MTAARDWRRRAGCRDVDPELFFPAAEDGAELEAQAAPAKAVCARCPVRGECLEWALSALPYGIAGGLTEEERRGARAPDRVRQQRPVVRPACATQPEATAAGRAAIRDGGSPREVAREFGVSERTALRWAAHVRAETSKTGAVTVASTSTAGGRGERGRGGSRAPLQVSRARNPLAGTSALEGHRG